MDMHADRPRTGQIGRPAEPKEARLSLHTRENGPIFDDFRPEYENAASGINEQLNRMRVPYEINENLMVEKLEILNLLGDKDSVQYWLLIARICELALICAGNYADNCEFRAAGDLLVNPRKIRVHIKGQEVPAVKKRHVPLSEQFKGADCSKKGWMDWFARNATVRVDKEPLIPHMLKKMETSDRFTQDYLDTIRQRAARAANTIGFLSAWNIGAYEDFLSRMKSATRKTRAFVEENMCRFSDRYFKELGKRISGEGKVSIVSYEFLR